jgi:hypothetical protein
MPDIEPGHVPSSHETPELPDWLPRSVGIFAQSLWRGFQRQGEPEVRELLLRLVSDSRMRKVWTELRKRERENYQPTEKFVHSVMPLANWFPDSRHALQHPHRQEGRPPPEILANYHALRFYEGQGPRPPLQDLAMVYFFDNAFALGQQRIRLVPISELRKKRPHFLKMAEKLRADAAEQERLGLYENRRIVEAALAYEELANAAPAPGPSLLVTRQQQRDPRLKGFVMLLADVAKNVFGSPLYGSVATTANVVFGRDDLTSGTVRKAYFSHPALKSR